MPLRICHLPYGYHRLCMGCLRPLTKTIDSACWLKHYLTIYLFWKGLCNMQSSESRYVQVPDFFFFFIFLLRIRDSCFPCQRHLIFPPSLCSFSILPQCGVPTFWIPLKRRSWRQLRGYVSCRVSADASVRKELKGYFSSVTERVILKSSTRL